VPLEQTLGTDSRRINFHGRLTNREVDRLQAIPKLDTVQFDRPVDPRSFDLLEERLFSHRPEVSLRVYGHYGTTADLSFVRRTPSLRRFFADCLQDAVGIEHVAALPRLEEISVGILTLPSFDFLELLPADLLHLRLDETKSRRPSLDSVPRFTKLRTLSLDGHTRGLASLGALKKLETLRLRCLRAPDLSFLAELPMLRSLSFDLGSSDDLSAIGGARGLTYFELDWTKRIADLSFVSRLTKVERLILGRLAQVRELPDFSPLVKLTFLTIHTMKNLESLGPVAKAPALEIFSGGRCGKLGPSEVAAVLDAPRLRRASYYFGNRKKEKEFHARASARGVGIRPGRS
jgi:hypothetical protein